MSTNAAPQITAIALADASHMALQHLDYDLETLTVTLRNLETQSLTSLQISAVEGFRVLDEGDLLEFWPHCSGSWLHEITAGGWLDQERLRTGFLSGDRALKEYLVAGADTCLNVLTWAAITLPQQSCPPPPDYAQ